MGILPVSTILTMCSAISVACPSPKLRKTLILARVTMLPASLHAIHFKHILNFGEGHLELRPRNNVTCLSSCSPFQTCFEFWRGTTANCADGRPTEYLVGTVC